MTEYREGDLVEAVKGDTVIRGRLRDIPGNPGRPQMSLTPALTTDLLHLAANGYTVTVVERATPPLPTEPGWYRSSCRGSTTLYRLDSQGQWREHSSRDLWPRTEADMKQFAPYVSVEPVPVTAKRVLDRVRSLFGAGALMLAEVDEIAAEFGVTES